MSQVKKLEDSKLWKNASQIGKGLYELLEHLPEDEGYPMKFKIKQYAFDVSSWIAEGVGSIDPRDKAWQLGKARSIIFSVKDAYKQAHELGYIKLDPEKMIAIETLTQVLDKEIKHVRAEIPKWFAEMGNTEEKKQ